MGTFLEATALAFAEPGSSEQLLVNFHVITLLAYHPCCHEDIEGVLLICHCMTDRGQN